MVGQAGFGEPCGFEKDGTLHCQLFIASCLCQLTAHPLPSAAADVLVPYMFFSICLCHGSAKRTFFSRMPLLSASKAWNLALCLR